jgi:hypothetical protein
MSSPFTTIEKHVLQLQPQGFYLEYLETWEKDTMSAAPPKYIQTKSTGRMYDKVREIPEDEVVADPSLVFSGRFIYDPATRMFQEFVEIH